jgi:hypothetical protein
MEGVSLYYNPAAYKRIDRISSLLQPTYEWIKYVSPTLQSAN